MLDKIIKELVCMVIIVSIATIFGVWILGKWRKQHLKFVMDEIRQAKIVKWNNNFNSSIKDTRSIAGKVADPEYYNSLLHIGTYTHKWHDKKLLNGEKND